MTNEEAIMELEADKALYETDNCHAGDGTPDGDLMEALDIAIDALKHKAEYRWHDLRKDPEDLPPEHKRVFAVFDFEIKDYVTAYCFKDFEGTVHWVGLYGLVPIAWKYLEEFEWK